MRRRTRTTLLIAAIVIILLGALAYLRQKAPPEVARLLPESDGIVYIDFEPLRTAMHFDQHPVKHDASYQRFIDATGFVFERDLRQAAIAIHHMQDPHGPNGPAAYSEVFSGRFDCCGRVLQECQDHSAALSGRGRCRHEKGRKQRL